MVCTFDYSEPRRAAIFFLKKGTLSEISSSMFVVPAPVAWGLEQDSSRYRVHHRTDHEKLVMKQYNLK